MKIWTVIMCVCFAFFYCQVDAQKNNTAHSKKTLDSCQHNPVDFSVDFNACNQLQVSVVNNTLNGRIVLWNFGDGSTAVAADSVVHLYSSEGVYSVMLVVKNKTGCLDTAVKKIGIAIDKGDIFQQKNIEVCKNDTVRLMGDSNTISNCWSPPIYLDSFNIYDPLSQPQASVNYQYNTVSKSINLINNGTFNLGNVDFTTDYFYDTVNSLPGNYYIGNNPQIWNSSYENCFADSLLSFGDTMLIVRGSTTSNAVVWRKNIKVFPNTNYLFSFYIQTFTVADSVVLQISFNGNEIVSQVSVPDSPCIKKKFATNWFSSSDTNIIIQVIDLNTKNFQNDFALDNMNFRAVYLKTDSLKIHVPDASIISVSKDTAICNGSSLQLNANSPTAIAYQWFPVNSLINANTASPVASPLLNTIYTVIVTDTNNCKNSDSVSVQVLPAPQVLVSADTTLCKGTSVQLSASGGSYYFWQPPSGLSNINIPNPIAAPATSTKYFVTVTNTNGCKSDDSVLVAIRPDPIFKVEPSSTNVCIGDSIMLTASGGDEYFWSPVNTLSNPYTATVSAFPSSYTNYQVIIQDTVCNNTDTVFSQVYVQPKPTTTVSKTNDINCTLGEAKLNATGGVNYRWTPGISLSDSTIPNPVAAPFATTIYHVIITNSNGCSNEDSIEVKVLTGSAQNGYLLPSAFTPNNDGINDCFGVREWGSVKNLQFSIYNRWGKRIFFTTDGSKCWDGTFNGQKQPMGTFIYQINASTICGVINRKGTVILIR